MRTAIAVIAVAGLTMTGCSSEDEPTTAPVSSAPTTAATSRPDVVFFAEGVGTKAGAVTMRSESGGTIQKDVALPMGDAETGVPGITSNGFTRGAFVYMSLQNKESSGSVTCRIEAKIDGQVKVVDEATSEGAYKVVSCQGRVP